MSDFVNFVQKLSRDRCNRLFWRLINDKTPVGIFLLNQNQSIIDQLKNLGFNLQCYLTTNQNEVAKPSTDLQTFHIRDLKKSNVKYVLSLPDISDNFAPMFKDAGIEKLNLLFGNQNTDEKFNFYMDHLSDLEETYNLLEDEESRETFRGFISTRITNRFTDLRFEDMPQYLTPNFLPKYGAITICAGACDGSTAAMFSDLGCKVYAFEMDHENFELSKKLATEKNFTLENFGLGAFEHEIDYVHYSNHIGGSHLGNDLEGRGQLGKTKIIPLDDYVLEKKLPSVDFIQLDTEGEELNILKGAAVSIARFKPTLAISIYHKPEDFWTLPRIIKSIRPDYKFGMRQYGLDVRFGSFKDDVDFHNFFRANNLPFLHFGIGECILFAK